MATIVKLHFLVKKLLNSVDCRWISVGSLNCTYQCRWICPILVCLNPRREGCACQGGSAIPWRRLQPGTASCLMSPHLKIIRLLEWGSMSLVSYYKLIRTDITLDLTQRPRKVYFFTLQLHNKHLFRLLPTWPRETYRTIKSNSSLHSQNTPWTSVCNLSAFPTLAHFPLLC